MSAAEQFHVSEVSPSHWRVAFDNGPVNLLDPDTIDQLGVLIGRIERDPNLTVVVFRSDKPGYFMAHWDFMADSARVAGMQPGPTGLHPYLDDFVRLSKVPVATISEIRGRTRGAAASLSSPPTSASRPRRRSWASSRSASAVPGGGPMARLGRLVGRGRALEILLGGDDIPAGLAAEYGYVNRAEVIAAFEAAIARVHDEPGVELYALHEGRDRLVQIEKYQSEQARSEHSKGAALAGLRSALEGKLSSDLDAQVLVPHPAGNAQMGAL